VTTLICWCGLDSRAPSSLYIATDSRFSWPSATQWDRGRKLSVRTRDAAILAFAGDVTFGQNLLVGLSEDALSDGQLEERLHELSGSFPIGSLEGTAFVFARRVGEGMATQFVVTAHEYEDRSWRIRNHPIPTEYSDIICAYGSGRAIALSELRKWVSQDVSGRTSRSVFSAFCGALKGGQDPQTGGAPQLAAIYRQGPAREIGIIWDNELHLGGLPPPRGMDLTSVKWHNDLFEVCDPNTRSRHLGAQPHARRK
jgi:hypothetical protein